MLSLPRQNSFVQRKAEKGPDCGQRKGLLDYFGRLMSIIHKTHHDGVIKFPLKVEIEEISLLEPARGDTFFGCAFPRDLKHPVSEIDTQYLACSPFRQSNGIMSGPAANIEHRSAFNGRAAFQGLPVAPLHSPTKELVNDRVKPAILVAVNGVKIVRVTVKKLRDLGFRHQFSP